MLSLNQIPAPNEEFICYKGDLITFSLIISEPRKGDAFLRTNIGSAIIRRKEIIESVEKGKPRLDADWHDFKMDQVSDCEYSITLPLLEVGVFAAKSFFRETGKEKITWPDGNNVKIKVEPADCVAGNFIYTAFVRQFNVAHASSAQNFSGTFRNLIKELDFIIGTLGFRNIQLLPIHPVPTSFAKMGTYGSPFAVLDLKNVNPAYAEFDKSATPMQQFEELVDAVHFRSAKLFLDIPINHTGWASWLQIHFPDWFVKNPDGTFKSPGAWGVTWEDLSELDYEHKKLWEHMAGVFLFWCKRGVDGYRCDAGYMIPQPVWEYIVAKVREEFPDTIFLLEGLGGKISVTENLLAEADLNWAYSELFQQYDRSQIESYLPACIERSEIKGLQINFAETHDNDRLAAKSKCYAKLRTALAALLSQNGGFGITAGIEWFATEKIDVHELNSLNWGAEENQVELIKKLNEILITEPAFFAGARLRMVQLGDHNGIAFLRETKNADETVLVAANLDDENEGFISWRTEDFPETDLLDLISGEKLKVETKGGLSCIKTNPGEALCLAKLNREAAGSRDVILEQRLKAKIFEVFNLQITSPENIGNTAPKRRLLAELQKDPAGFCAESLKLPAPLCITNWQYPQDLNRKVVVPSSHFLLLKSKVPFNLKIIIGDKVVKCENSLPGSSHFVLLAPETFSEAGEYQLNFIFYSDKKTEHRESKILVISPKEELKLKFCYSKDEVLEKNACALLTNGRGGMALVRGEWGVLKSKYDSFLAANLNPSCPVDRHILFTRFRAWVVCSDFSREINIDNLISFEKISNNCAKWSFRLPVGQGKTVDLDISLELVEDTNISIVKFCRLQSSKNADCKLPGNLPVKIIVRPDIEDRNFHETTKAINGAENDWPTAVKSEEISFTFSPAENRKLEMKISKGRFVCEPEWNYMVHLPEEAERGLDAETDLFSPGYFSFGLCEDEALEIVVEAEKTERAEKTKKTEENISSFGSLKSFLKNSIKQFIVRRDDSLTVIAGYPWFLDWGRDTLIALRGIISAGFVSEAEEILRQFGKYEKDGTLPNMIRGDDQSDRDTSDAPLWFFTACSDLGKATGNWNFINENCGEKTILQVLESIIENYVKGTPNGIKMDDESGLVFSPSHFTWMDTNFPAGTPREGYPIEIQALWVAALDFLFQISGKEKYKNLAEKARSSISELFTKSPNGCLADCLYAKPGTPARQAKPDDAVRPNQLLAITLGAVKDKKLCEKIIAGSEQLLVPGAIRSLADLPVENELPVCHDGRLLNDPKRPYWGKYSGDEDTRRKPAYHNGTAWTWQFPSYAEAVLVTYGEEAEETAKSILLSSKNILEKGCVLQVPEITDGDFPHVLKGCCAQAWGMTELCRLFKNTNLI